MKNALEKKEDGEMGSPYLNSNEAIVLSTHNIVINTLESEAILTNTRLLLIDRGDDQIRPQDIPFTAIETVTIGEDSAGNPMLSLSILIGPGLTHSLGIIFPQLPKTNRNGERDEWAVRIKELSVAAQREGGARPMELLPPWIPATALSAAEGEPAAGLSPAGDQFRNPPITRRKPLVDLRLKNTTMITIGAIIIAILAIAAVAYLFAPSLEKNSIPVTPIPTPVITQRVTPVVTLVATTVVLQTDSPTTAPSLTATPTTIPPVIIPQTGVWALVKYIGSYSGTIGAPGRFADIKGSGTHFYQIPARNETISAVVQKLDNSGNVLTIEFYNNGRMVKNGSVKSPSGTLALYADLKNV